LKCRADFSYGGEGWFVRTGEATEGDVDRLLLRLLWLTVFDQSRWYETGSDGRIAGTIGEILSVYGEVE